MTRRRAPRIAVLAWTVATRVHDGRPYARDLGASPGLRTVVEGRAATWRLDAGPDDLEDAQRYADIENARRDPAEVGAYVVLTYPRAEREPLERARREVVLRSARVRTDGDRASDCRWAAWLSANAEGVSPERAREIESALLRDGFYEEPGGGSAGFRLEVVL